jgi:hypothetical protein
LAKFGVSNRDANEGGEVGVSPPNRFSKIFIRVSIEYLMWSRGYSGVSIKHLLRFRGIKGRS